MKKKYKEVKMTRKGVVRYGVLCDRLKTLSTFYTLKDAQDKADFLNEDYKGSCKHRVQKVLITPINK